MYVYSGRGIIVMLSALLPLLISKGIAGLISSPSRGNSTFETAVLFLFWLPGVINYFLERIFCKGEGEETMYDRKGRQVKVNNYSTFFFIRVKYWTYILPVLFLVAGLYSKFR